MSVDDVKSLLSGNTIYHKMVSDTLDVAQIFFSYPTMQDKVDIVVWNMNQELQKLLLSPNPNHQVACRSRHVPQARALEMTHTIFGK